jgi:hypothetical protein
MHVQTYRYVHFQQFANLVKQIMKLRYIENVWLKPLYIDHPKHMPPTLIIKMKGRANGMLKYFRTELSLRL